MTKLTTQGEKDSANTDLPQFHDPDDQDIDLDTAWIPRIRSHQTKPISRTTPRRKQSRLTLTRPPSSPTSPTHDATSSKHSPSPPSATCNARNRSGPNPKTT